MKKTNLSAILITLVGLTFSFNTIAKEQTISQTIELSNPGKPAFIEIEITTGSISVVGYKGNKIEITANVTALDKVKTSDFEHDDDNHENYNFDYNINSKNKQTKRSLKGLKLIKNTAINLEIEEEDNEVSIGSETRNQYVELLVKVPFNSNLEIELYRSVEEIKISNVYGAIDVENMRGSILATGIKGPIVAESHRKDVIVVFESFETKKPSSINANRGNIDVTLPKKSKVLVEVKNYRGEIYSGLSSEFKSTHRVRKNESNHQRITFGGAMSAQLNGGTQTLMLNAFRGDIYIREK